MIKGLWGLLKMILFSLFFILCVAFALNNADFVKLNLSPLNYVVEVRLFILILAAYFLGSLLTLFFGHLRRFVGLFGKIMGLLNFGRLYNARKIKVLESELSKLRAKPAEPRGTTENAEK